MGQEVGEEHLSRGKGQDVNSQSSVNPTKRAISSETGTV